MTIIASEKESSAAAVSESGTSSTAMRKAKLA